MTKVQIESEKLTPFGGFFRLWSYLMGSVEKYWGVFLVS